MGGVVRGSPESGGQAGRAAGVGSAPKAAPVKKKLSYLENREYESIEQRIAEAERILSERRALLEDPGVGRDGARLAEVYREVEDAQRVVDELYERWAELEAKIG